MTQNDNISGKRLLAQPDLRWHFNELIQANPPRTEQNLSAIIKKLKIFHDFIDQGYRCSLDPDSEDHQHSLLNSDSPNSIILKNKQLIQQLERSLKEGHWNPCITQPPSPITPKK
ncbi:MAG TPA: hypothetical protein QF353_05260 [Gammaproteobacteria bacterium]|nr:hypothetical protein [Gammaproteobacteria bacterium]